MTLLARRFIKPSGENLHWYRYSVLSAQIGRGLRIKEARIEGDFL
jgi:hypothetical protein